MNLVTTTIESVRNFCFGPKPEVEDDFIPPTVTVFENAVVDDFAASFLTFKSGKSAVTLRLYKNGRIRRFITTRTTVQPFGREKVQERNNLELDPLTGIELSEAKEITLEELKAIQTKGNKALRQIKKSVVAAAPTAPSKALPLSEAPIVNATPAAPSPTLNQVEQSTTESNNSRSESVASKSGKLVVRGWLRFSGVGTNTRGHGKNVHTFNSYCIDVQDELSKAEKRINGVDLERALQVSGAKNDDLIEVILIDEEDIGENRKKKFYDIKLIGGRSAA